MAPPIRLMRPALLLALAVLTGGAAPLAHDYPFTVTRVIDGDTLRGTVTIWLGQHIDVAVRISGIDAPELRGAKCAEERALAQRAKIFAEQFVADGRVRISQPKHDKYAGRIVAEVTVMRDGKRLSLAAELLKAGLARAYDGGRRAAWCST